MPLIKHCKRYFKQLRHLMKCLQIKDSWKSLKSCDVLLMAHENDRSFEFEGLFYSHIIDTVGFYLVDSNPVIALQSLSLPFSNSKQDKAHASPHSINRKMLYAKLQWKLGGQFFLKPRHCPELKLWLKVLALTKPKVVIAIQPHPLLCQACRIKGVEVFDYQHGLIKEIMPEYGHSFMAKAPLEKLPTGYLCWDEDSAEVLRQWATPRGIRVLVPGNPWVSRFMYPKPQDVLVSQALSQLPNTKHYEKTILISLQPGLDQLYPDSFEEGEFIPKSLKDALSSSVESVLWLVRLHPIQFKDPQLSKKIIQFFSQYPNVEVDNATKAALPAVLSVVNGHITWNSCVVLEAAFMGVASFVMDPFQNGVDSFFTSIESNGLASRASQDNASAEIKDWVRHLNSRLEAKPFIPFNGDTLIEELGIAEN